ncbi:MAG: penicillin-binding protein, partial [Dysgonamonadaceae bacterium]|nr:penicillin-binding protein [Dysgonamonadaceae bacterium]
MKGKNTTFTKRIVKWFWILFGGGILFIALIFLLISQGVIGYMPPVEELENPINKYASQVISVDNQLLGIYAQNKENRIYSTYEDLSPKLIDAL